MATVIVVQGTPAAGKTTISDRLARDLGIGVIHKDSLKEYLGDTIGVPASEFETKQYGRAVIGAMFAMLAELAKTNKTFIFESAFWSDYANINFERSLAGTESRVMQLYVYCDPDLIQPRYSQRIESGNRHAVHIDTLAGEMEIETMLENYKPLDIRGATTLRLDTTHLTDDIYTKVKQQIQDFIKGEE